MYGLADCNNFFASCYVSNMIMATTDYSLLTYI